MVATNGAIQQNMVAGTFVKNAWYMAGWEQEVDDGKFLTRMILGEPVLIFRNKDGSLTALEDRCPHRFAPLSLGKILPNGNIQCGYHGLEFDGTGACVNNPHKSGNVPANARAARFTAIAKHRCIWIWMGDKQPDMTSVPDYSVLDTVTPFADTALDMIKVEANYKLIVDNLLDLSHVAYLHVGTLGNAQSVTASIDVEQDGDDLLVTRLASGVDPVSLHAMQWPGHPEKVDHFQQIRWMAPSSLNLFVGITEVGKPWEEGTGIWATHKLTPETDHSTHYFFTAARFGIRSQDPEWNKEIQHKIGVMRRYAFEVEDGPMIEAQQRVIDGAPRELEPANINVDLGAVRFRRAIARMEAAD